MKIEMKEELLLRPQDFKPSMGGWKIDGIFNPGAIRMKDGKIMLYVRVAESSPKHKKGKKCPIFAYDSNGKLVFKDGQCRLENISHFRRVILNENGFDVEKIDLKPAFTGLPGDGEYGVEDPRIVKIKNKYFMTYVIVSLNEGVSTALAVSKDLKKWKRLGIIFREQNKDVVLFPEKIKGKYVALNRPEGNFIFSKTSIWISHSTDLIYWGREKSIIQTRRKSWDSNKIGSGCPPIKTTKGWLEIYHGVKKVKGRSFYSAGAVLLDKKNPLKILARTPRDKPLIAPDEEYEKKGFMSGVVFPTGIVKDLNKKDILVYSGGADQYISVKQINIKDILNSLEKVKRGRKR